MGNTPKEITHEVFDAVSREGRGSSGSLPIGVLRGGQSTRAVSAVPDQREDTLQVVGSLPERGDGRAVRPLAPSASIAFANWRADGSGGVGDTSQEPCMGWPQDRRQPAPARPVATMPIDHHIDPAPPRYGVCGCGAE